MFRNTSNIGIFGGTFTEQHQHQHHHGPSLNIHRAKKSAIDRLMEASSLGALHNSGERFDPPKCHPNTRTAVLQRLMDWLISETGWDSMVLWLYGPAGAGKSAIAQTFAEQCYARGGLLASFFFSRSDPKRNNEKVLAATLSYQVSSHIPGFWEILEPIIDKDPAIFQLNFETQFRTLILNPLLHLSNTGRFRPDSPLPNLFIIDGIDECNGPDVQADVLSTISSALQRHPLVQDLPLRFIIVSRPEHHLTSLFSDAPLINLTLQLELDDTYQPDADIRLYLLDSFRNIRKSHIMQNRLPKSWPSGTDIDKLLTKSSGQFIYAATVVRYVSSPRHNPLDRLKVIHGLLPVNNDKPYAQLDALYIGILSAVEDIDATLRVLGFSQLLYEIENVDELERFMLLDPGSIQLLLLDLPSVVNATDDDEPIEFLHASFRDFLFDPQRSFQFYINPNQIHAEAAHHCVTHINSFWSSHVITRGGTQSDTLGVAFLFLVSNLREAGPLRENAILREEVLNMSYFQSFKTLSESPWVLFSNNDVDAGRTVTRLLKFLQTSDFSNAEELYLHHRGIWDQTMRDDLALVPKISGLAFWTAYMVAVHGMASGSHYGVYLDTIMALPSTSPEPEASLYMPLSFFTGETHDHTVFFDGTRHRTVSLEDDARLNSHPEYLVILKEFLTDPSRAGIYAVDESTYTMAAEFLVAFAVRPWDVKKEQVKSHEGQWDLVWDALISILPRAGYSDELVGALSHESLTFFLGRPLTDDLREYLRSLFGVISSYLSRWTASHPTGIHIVIDWTKWKPHPHVGKDHDDNDSAFSTDMPFILDISINT